jgi:hypothetical protein
MPQDIATGTTTSYNTRIPSASDTADIVAAFRLYHYGEPGDAEKSLVHHLSNLQSQISNFPNPVPLSLWSARGALVSSTTGATSSSDLATISLGTPGQVLTVLSGTSGTGIAWQAPEITLINSVTMTNKTLVDALVAIRPDGNVTFRGPAGNAFATVLGVGSITQNRTITLPDASTELVGTNSTQTLTNKSIDAAQLTATAQTASTARSTLQIFNAQTVADGGDNRTPYSGKIYVANPSVVGATGANIDGAAAGDLWFW